MMLIGYGFLIVYLRFHRWQSLGLTFFVAAFSAQLYILFAAFWYRWWWGFIGKAYNIVTFDLIAAIKGSIGCLIALGALIGKVDILQMVFFWLIFVIFYTLDEAIIFFSIYAHDIGGWFYIHTFSSCFGIVATWIYS